MRIRKRFLSLSRSSPDLHGGDGHHNHHHHPPLTVVQHQEEVHPNGNLRVLYDNTHNSHLSDPPPPCSSDQIGAQPSTWVSSGAGSHGKEPIFFPQKEVESKSKTEIIKIDDDDDDIGRKESILCPEASSPAATTPSPPTTANLVLKGWLEGDRLIPIKKRRGSFGKKVNHDVVDDNEIIEETMKPKPTKNDKRVVKQEASATSPKKNNNKNGKRGNVIMEGSRCSRVNGRGWRCCQQTLVGYSLCEHHLGKGRLRSMTSVRGRAQKIAPKERVSNTYKDKKVDMISIHDNELEDDDDEEEELEEWEEESKSSMEDMKKKLSKKKKLGVVKARSLSSLLSQMGS